MAFACGAASAQDWISTDARSQALGNAGVAFGEGAADPVVNLSPGVPLAFTSGDLAAFFDGIGVPGPLSPAGITFGLPLFPTVLDLGISLKEIITETFARRLTLREIDEDDDLADRVRKEFEEERKRSNDFNVDVGALLRPASWLRVGVAARNLIPMRVDVAGTGGDLRLRPQVRAGVALRLFDLINLGADIDLTENRMGLLPGYSSRFVGGGVELDIPVVKLRVGYFDNLASPFTQGTLTAGLGIKILAFTLDVSAQAALRERVIRPETLDGDKKELSLPERALVGITLGFNTPF